MHRRTHLFAALLLSLTLAPRPAAAQAPAQPGSNRLTLPAQASALASEAGLASRTSGVASNRLAGVGQFRDAAAASAAAAGPTASQRLAAEPKGKGKPKVSRLALPPAARHLAETPGPGRLAAAAGLGSNHLDGVSP